MSDTPTTVRDLMAPAPDPIRVSTTVGAAIDLIRAGSLAGLPVVEGDRVVGFVTPVQLLRQPLYRMVAEIMITDLTPATPELPLSYAYNLLTRQQVEVLPVVEEGRLVGLLSLMAILEARNQERDPLTGLPWAAGLRSWTMAALGRGEEVVILFVDMDNFRIVNKALGHVVGDDIVRSVAYLLGTCVDRSTDFLCRYAGDEFAIATIRRSEDARALAQRLRETISLPVEIEGREERVTASVGLAGGRRVEPRTAAHIASTVEDLITLASRGSTLAKESGKGIIHHSRSGEERALRAAGRRAPVVDARFRMETAAVTTEAHQSTAVVGLGLGSRTVRGTASARVVGRGVPFLVAEATLGGVAQVIGAEFGFLLEDLSLLPSEGETVAVAILAAGAASAERLVGSARAADPHVAVARAVLNALNRRIGRMLADALRAGPPPDGSVPQAVDPAVLSGERVPQS
ncbi:MAG TPA: GGDEF domain-containing protein [bacterium]|nr:GGDEF domain-containing protein [bacterium]